MKIKYHIGLLGGTFDPIHNGHLHVAHHVEQALALDWIEFLPCYQPPHRSMPKASEQDREAMIALAIKNNEKFKLNTYELEERKISYTINTLKHLATPDKALYFIIGFDAFLQFHTWFDWQNIINYCHLIVVNRPHHHSPIPSLLQAFYQKHKADKALLCRQQRHGYILMLNIPPSTTSATHIRESLEHNSKQTLDLPEAVRMYIQAHHLY